MYPDAGNLYDHCIRNVSRPFFNALLNRKAGLVLDVRLKNTNQLCGFTKQKDLEYLIPQITGADYVHDLRFAPTPKLLKFYQAQLIDWKNTGNNMRC